MGKEKQDVQSLAHTEAGKCDAAVGTERDSWERTGGWSFGRCVDGEVRDTDWYLVLQAAIDFSCFPVSRAGSSLPWENAVSADNLNL